MSNGNNIWERSSKLLFVINYQSKNDLNANLGAIDKLTSGKEHVFVLCVIPVNLKGELTSLNNVHYISEKDFNLLGKIKEEEIKNLIQQQFDLLVVLNSLEGKVLKMLRKINANKSVGVNSNLDFLSINVNSDNNAAVHLFNFAKQTLEKIK